MWLGIFTEWFSSNTEIHAQQKMWYFCYFQFVLMVQTVWKQSAREVLSFLTTLLLHSFQIQHIKRQEWKERRTVLILDGSVVSDGETRGLWQVA